jgi:CRP-like cAMP-binding protein
MIDMEIQKQLIKKQVCFANLSDTEINALTSLFFEKKVPAGTVIANEGDVADNIYFIVSGEVEVKKMVSGGSDTELQTIATLGPNDAIGLKESGFFSTTGLRTATLVAKTDVHMLRISITTFYGFALTYPTVKEAMLNSAKEIVKKMG